MNCPNCGATYTYASECDESGETTRRLRKCTQCNFAFWTVERIESVDRQQAFQASMFHLITEANGSREKARTKIRTDCQARIGESTA